MFSVAARSTFFLGGILCLRSSEVVKVLSPVDFDSAQAKKFLCADSLKSDRPPCLFWVRLLALTRPKIRLFGGQV